MKVTVYKLLGMVKNDNVDYKYVKYFDRINEKDDVMLACAENIIYKLDHSNIELNDIVEILEEPKGIPEKMMMCTSGIMSYEAVEHITTELKDKINEILDYLESKGESNE